MKSTFILFLVGTLAAMVLASPLDRERRFAPDLYSGPQLNALYLKGDAGRGRFHFRKRDVAEAETAIFPYPVAAEGMEGLAGYRLEQAGDV